MKILSKSTLIVFAFALIQNQSKAQIFDGTTPGILWANPLTTSVGIGTSNPYAPLNVVGPNAAPSALTPNGGALSVGGIGTNNALQFGVYTPGSLGSAPYTWIQARNQTTTSNFYELSLQPLGGHLRINDNKLYLRGGSINSHGLGYDAFNTGIDGPVLFGYTKGALYTTNGGVKHVLGWENTGFVTVSDNLEVGPVAVRSSAIVAQLWASNKTGMYITTRHGSPYGYAIKLDVDKDLTKGIAIHNTIVNAETFQVYGDGRTYIGLRRPQPPHNDAMLSVDGKVACKSLYVLKPLSWADYVFKDKKTETLENVEKYINENKHLPGIPSEEEVLTNGYDINEMDAKLLSKIETLYLHIIELEKEIKQLKNK
jgi:hypothetical protein